MAAMPPPRRICAVSGLLLETRRLNLRCCLQSRLSGSMVVMTIEEDALVLRRPQTAPRTGWADFKRPPTVVFLEETAWLPLTDLAVRLYGLRTQKLCMSGKRSISVW